MNLYEIKTGYVGESYERCYVWADSEERAKQLFKETSLADIRSFKILLTSDQQEFVTILSDSGWEVQE